MNPPAVRPASRPLPAAGQDAGAPRPGFEAVVPNPQLKLLPVQILTAFVQLYIVTVTIFAPSPSVKAPLPG